MKSDLIELILGDITKLEVDAVVNAANNSLIGGGGVDGAIHRAAGTVLHEECMRYIVKSGTLPTGRAMITRAGNMPAKYVIHTVGPIWRGGTNDENILLAAAYRSSLELSADFHLPSIAFPNISSGVYGFPKAAAAEIAINTVKEFLQIDNIIKRVVFCCFERENYDIYSSLLGLTE